MNVKMDDWKNGWYGIELGLSDREIDRLIRLLLVLKEDHDQHFHIRSDIARSGNLDEGGVGDITIYVKDVNPPDNLFLSGIALPPGEEIDLS